MPTLTDDQPTLPLDDFVGVTSAPRVGECGREHEEDEDCDGYQCPSPRRTYNERTGRYELLPSHWVHPDDGWDNETSCETCDLCPSHCSCVQCGDCSERFTDSSDICVACSDCTNCCICGVCNFCDRRISESAVNRGRAEPICGDCDGCSNCCNCNLDSDSTGIVERHVAEPHFWTPEKFQLKRNRSRRYAALEVEFANVETPGDQVMDAAAKWDTVITTDGSISGGNVEFELNTAPAAGDLLIDQLSDFGRAFEAQGVEANDSCGLHVHVDCRDFSFYDMRRMVLLYQKIEPALFGMVPPGRKDNGYANVCGAAFARAITKSQMPKDSKANMLNGIYECGTQKSELKYTVSRAKNQKYHGARYSALNLHSWVYRGTIECRLHHGITDTDGLVNWALLWVAIVDSAYKLTEREIKKLSGSPFEILLSLAPSPDVANWITSETNEYKAAHRRHDYTHGVPDGWPTDY